MMNQKQEFLNSSDLNQNLESINAITIIKYTGIMKTF